MNHMQESTSKLSQQSDIKLTADPMAALFDDGGVYNYQAGNQASGVFSRELCETQPSLNSSALVDDPVGSNNFTEQSPISPGSMTNTTSVSLAQNSTSAVCGTDKSGFKRPLHKNLHPSRIQDAGPTQHPDPKFRPYGPNQWTDILHDHTLLRFISKNEIGDIKKHCEKLGQTEQGSTSGPVLIDNGPYDTSDARAVWKYCTVYIKRRDQLRNNVSAKKSRSRKDNEVKHWKSIALAAGAHDKPFRFQEDDMAYDPAHEKAGLISQETQEAIDEMRQNWNVLFGCDGGVGGNLAALQTSLESGPIGGLPVDTEPNMMSLVESQAQFPSPDMFNLSDASIHAEVYGAPSVASTSLSPDFGSVQLPQGQLPLPAFQGAADAALRRSPTIRSSTQVNSPAVQLSSDYCRTRAPNRGQGHAQCLSEMQKARQQKDAQRHSRGQTKEQHQNGSLMNSPASYASAALASASSNMPPNANRLAHASQLASNESDSSLYIDPELINLTMEQQTEWDQFQAGRL
ncbi:hypothetical protein BD289DRAFT_479381 [Coniella lustricola]|uniref:Uncharacterized protein n=1 Tax=Coniella lustricola TaxID=2025994 RepID=A0A2T3AJG0_9PEZI|nr:hypothetical protein BD289DRAFT_479381 [Coniella lustricola]